MLQSAQATGTAVVNTEAAQVDKGAPLEGFTLIYGMHVVCQAQCYTQQSISCFSLCMPEEQNTLTLTAEKSSIPEFVIV